MTSKRVSDKGKPSKRTSRNPFRIFGLLLHKSYLIRKKYWVKCLIFRIILPLIIILGMKTARDFKAASTTKSQNQTINDNYYPIEVIGSWIKPKETNFTLYYIPDNPNTKKIMDTVKKCLKLDNSSKVFSTIVSITLIIHSNSNRRSWFSRRNQNANRLSTQTKNCERRYAIFGCRLDELQWKLNEKYEIQDQTFYKRRWRFIRWFIHEEQKRFFNLANVPGWKFNPTNPAVLLFLKCMTIEICLENILIHELFWYNFSWASKEFQIPH